jgi:serine/threonine-protein kinase SRPK3
MTPHSPSPQPASSHNSIDSTESLPGFPEDLRLDGENNSGYFPARLRQPLEGGQFCIVRKLGWGFYSSVWLARDKKYVVPVYVNQHCMI